MLEVFSELQQIKSSDLWDGEVETALGHKIGNMGDGYIPYMHTQQKVTFSEIKRLNINLPMLARASSTLEV